MIVLQKICKCCGRILLTDEDIVSFTKRYERGENRVILNKQVTEKARRMKLCIRCGAFNGAIKKVPPFKMYHERYPVETKGSKCPDTHQFVDSFRFASEDSDQILKLVEDGRAQDDLTPLRVYCLFQLIQDSDCFALDVAPSAGRPETLLIKVLLEFQF